MITEIVTKNIMENPIHLVHFKETGKTTILIDSQKNTSSSMKMKYLFSNCRFITPNIRSLIPNLKNKSWKFRS